MFRSMQLIRQLDCKADDYSRKVDSLTKEFASLPERARASTRNDIEFSAEFAAPIVSDRELELRLRISRAINGALAARKEAAAEARRVKENVWQMPLSPKPSPPNLGEFHCLLGG
jgi:hypothetical protein